MTKQEIVNQVAKRTGVERNVIGIVIDETMNVIKENLCKGIPVYIRGMFSLVLVRRKGKKGRNIKKNISIDIPEHYTPAAKFSKEIKDAVKKIKTN